MNSTTAKLPNVVVLVRGINVGGKQIVSMTDLRRIATDAGLSEVQTLLQSGNLVGHCKKPSPSGLERSLQDAAKNHLDRSLEFFVRTTSQWGAIVADNPFPKEAKADPSHLLVAFLQDAIKEPTVAELRGKIPGREMIAGAGRELYIVYPDGIGRSKLTAALIDKILSTRCTARNWNTILKLAALLEPNPSDL